MSELEFDSFLIDLLEFKAEPIAHCDRVGGRYGARTHARTHARTVQRIFMGRAWIGRERGKPRRVAPVFGRKRRNTRAMLSRGGRALFL